MLLVVESKPSWYTVLCSVIVQLIVKELTILGIKNAILLEDRHTEPVYLMMNDHLGSDQKESPSRWHQKHSMCILGSFS